VTPNGAIVAARPLEDALSRYRLEAEETRQRLVDFISTASDIIWETDADLRIVRRHAPGNQQIQGNKAEDNYYFLSKTMLEISSGDPERDPLLAAHYEDLLARRPFRGFVHRIEREDGSVVWRESNGIPFFSEDGTFRGYRGTARDITHSKTDEARIVFLARHDSLTSLPNRTLLRERLEQALADRQPGMFLAVHILDLDGFRTINDSMGNPVGDSLLRSVGERLSKCIRHSDTVARVGGDEFAIVQVDLEEPGEAAAFAERIAEAIHQPYEIDGHCITPTVSIGIALSPSNGIDPEQLLRNADIALNRAEQDEPGSWRFFEPEMGLRVQARRALETDLRSALGNGEFELFYQPFFNVVSQKTCAFEALLRWRHPSRGMILPDQFIPLAEETGLIVAIGEWILMDACREAATWPEHVSVSVNLSPVQFRKSPVKAVRDALAASGLAASRLELEITETVLMQESDSALAALNELRELGCRISMDDFGTGYSSLSYLRSFPFDKIKIDRSFIQDLNRKQGSVAIVRAIATLGASLRLATTAEGVETKEQFSIVRAEGCTEVQGYLFSKPRPARDIPGLLAAIPDDTIFEFADSHPSYPRPMPAPKRFFVDMPSHSDVLNGKPV
jgi:diguanylate cyclase (GGDEF)-like protein/PAS domain S-box-containing protein